MYCFLYIVLVVFSPSSSVSLPLFMFVPGCFGSLEGLQHLKCFCTGGCHTCCPSLAAADGLVRSTLFKSVADLQLVWDYTRVKLVSTTID